MNTPWGDDAVDDSADNHCHHGVPMNEDCHECASEDADLICEDGHAYDVLDGRCWHCGQHAPDRRPEPRAYDPDHFTDADLEAEREIDAEMAKDYYDDGPDQPPAATLVTPPSSRPKDFQVVDVPRSFLPAVRMLHRAEVVRITRRKG